ncbi:hypothetical protein [Methylobacterium segetis]|uniref:hypothetical protein n=1 Tax=Methylobacterium segetis TaxID=2488750 RepID=UPI00104A883C|nr:hypothetical protein [Methylobacterium segetis]
MPVSWPADLSYAVSQQAYAVQALDLPPMKSPMQSGKTRMRRQYTLRIATLGYGWEFTSTELARFRSFIANEAGAGTAEITLPVWIESAQTYASRQVRIRDGASGVSERKLGFDRTLVSCVLEVQSL